tara:strand:+ start:103 stop:564 length:462 start_codon:yes stop_codon:yes gene_type:complete
MTDFNLKLKIRVHELCIQLVKDKIKLVDDLYLSNQNAFNSSSKSSAGDKHETSRAMIHLDQEKLSSQILELNKSLRILSQIDIVEHSSVNMGSLFRTDHSTFYISIGLGKVSFNGTDIFIISPVSPLSQRLIGLNQHDSIEFRGITHNILFLC